MQERKKSDSMIRKLGKIEEDRQDLVEKQDNFDRDIAEYQKNIDALLKIFGVGITNLASREGGQTGSVNIPQEQQAANLFGEGSLLAQIVEALENVRQAREAVTNADVAVQAVDEQKRADEREKTQREMNEKIKLDIKNESNLYTDQTELLRGDLKKAADSALATFSKVLPEITKQFTVASDKAQSDYDVAAKIAEREALEYINSDQNKARKHPVTLETNPAYKAKLLELDQERLIALDKALEARDRSLKALEMQVEMEDKILGLRKPARSDCSRSRSLSNN